MFYNIKVILKNIYILVMLVLRVLVRTLFALFFFIFLILGVMLFTSKGTLFLWNQTVKFVPELKGELIDGHLGRGFTFKNLSYTSDEFNFDCGYVSIGYNILTLFRGSLDVEYLETKDILVVIGGRPEDMPPLAQFLYERLSEVKAYTLNQKTKDLEKFQEPIVDTTIYIAPKVSVTQEAEVSEVTQVTQTSEVAQENLNDIQNKDNKQNKEGLEVAEGAKNLQENKKTTENKELTEDTLKTLKINKEANAQVKTNEEENLPKANEETLVKTNKDKTIVSSEDKDNKDLANTQVNSDNQSESITDDNTDIANDDESEKSFDYLFNEDNIIISKGNKFINKSNEFIDQTKENIIHGESLLNIPIDITFEKITVNHFLMMSEVIDIGVGELILKANIYGDTVEVSPSEVSYVDILLHNERFISSEEVKELPQDPNVIDKANLTTAQIKDFLLNPYDKENIAKYIDELPKVFIPININVQALTMNNVMYHQDGYSTGVMSGELEGAVSGTNIKVNKLWVTHNLGQVTLSNGEMVLDKYYPIRATLNAFSHNKEWFDFLNTHTLEVKAQGDLADMSGEINLKGRTNLNIKARLGILGPKLPFNAIINGKNVGFPVLEPDYLVKNINIQTYGSLERIFSKIHAEDISLLDYPLLNLDLKVSNDFESAKIETLEIFREEDLVKIKGDIDWSNGVSFNGDLNGNLEDSLDYDLPIDFGSKFTLSFGGKFKDADSWNAHLDNLEVKGKITNKPLEILAKDILGNSKGNFKIGALKLLATEENIVDIKGEINDNVNLKGEIALNNLALFYPPLEGSVRLSLNALGKRESPTLDLKLNVPYINMEGFSLNKLNGKVNIRTNDFYVTNSNVALALGDLSTAKTTILNNLKLSLTGSEKNHTLSLITEVYEKPFKLRLNGSLTNKRETYQGSLSTLKGKYQAISLSLNEPLDFLVKNWSDAIINKHSWLINGNKLTINNLSYVHKEAKINLEAHDFNPMSFAQYIPSNMNIKAKVNLDADLTYRDNKPQGIINLISNNGEFIFNKEGEKFKELSLKVNLIPNEAQVNLLLDLEKDGLIKLSPVVHNPLLNSRKLGGNILIKDIDLAIVNKFSAQVSNSQGLLNADLNLGGPLNDPEAYGTLSINDMSINTTVDIGRIYDINTLMNFKGHSADLDTKFSISGKKASILGDLSWSPEVKGNINLKTEEIPLNLLGYGSGRISLDILGKFAPNVNIVTGNVNFPYADIKVKSLPESSVSASSDVVEIKRNDDGTIKVKREMTSPIELDVKVNLGPEIRIFAMGLKTNVEGKLKIKQKPNKPLTINGRVNLIDGKFKAYGQNLIIDKGRISFVGDATNPHLDIRAIRDPDAMENENVTVGVMVTGDASNPKVSLFSKPQLSQSETLSYLLRGKGMETANTNTSSMSTQLLLGVGLMQTSSFIGQIGEKFGLQEVSLDSKGEGDGTAVEISAYVLPKVQVSYGYGLYNALSEFKVRYEMFPRFYIEGVSALERSVDAIYKFEFDFKKRPEIEDED